MTAVSGLDRLLTAIFDRPLPTPAGFPYLFYDQ
jgi:hypothetical protein